MRVLPFFARSVIRAASVVAFVVAVAFLAAMAVSMTGCAGYHLGAVNRPTAGEKTVEILPFNNQTLQPRLGDAVTQALREQFQTDGTYRLATGEAGDVVVTGVITAYNREPLSYLNTDVATVENYRVGIVAHITVRDRITGKLLLDKNNVRGYTLVHVGNDLASAERQALPLLAEDMARNTVEMVTEGTW